MSRIVNVSDIDARTSIIGGGEAGGLAGWSISAAGDINGDGFDDIIIGAPYSDIDGAHGGAAYVVYGHAGRLGAIDLSDLSPAQGFVIDGSHTTGLSVSGAGDVNGDGFDDIIVGTYTHSALGGYGIASAYVVFGKAEQTGPVDLAALASSDGFSISGAIEFSYYASFALDVSDAGDVNGDGFDDVIIGARYAHNGTGAAYVVFGNASGNVDLSNLAAAQGFAILGANPNDHLGASVSAAGDINADGFDDVIVGAFGVDGLDVNDSGATYVLFGKADGFATVDVAHLSASDGFIISGGLTGVAAGISVSSVGDVNGDGFDDIIVGAPFFDAGGTDSGNAYVIFGKAGGFGNIDLANFGSAGFIIQGGTDFANVGLSVSGAGDVNHDGFDDLVVLSSFGVGETSVGRATVIFGKASGLTTVNVANLPSTEGFILQNAMFGFGFVSVSNAGDVDRDGYADLIIGSPFGSNGGAAFVVSTRAVLNGVNSDFNGDGRSDVLWRNDGGTLHEWLGQVDGSFVDNVNYVDLNPVAFWHLAGTADFNGDGHSDILWRGDDGTVQEWLGQNSGGFSDNAAHVNVNPGLGWHIQGTGDFNGDGRGDILWRNDQGTLREWLGQPDGSFAGNIAYVDLNPVLYWHVAGTGDFNGDGHDDILWRGDDGTIQEWLGLDNGGFADNASHVNVNPGTNWHVEGTGDFNGDGRSDVLLRNDQGTLHEWLGQSDGSFVDNVNYVDLNPILFWHVAQTGDFNGDGHDDILWRGDDGRVEEWLGQESGGFSDNSPSVNVNPGTHWHVQEPFVHDAFL